MADVLPQIPNTSCPRALGLRLEFGLGVQLGLRLVLVVELRLKISGVGGSGAGRRDNLFRFYWVFFFKISTKQKSK